MVPLCDETCATCSHHEGGRSLQPQVFVISVCLRMALTALRVRRRRCSGSATCCTTASPRPRAAAVIATKVLAVARRELLVPMPETVDVPDAVTYGVVWHGRILRRCRITDECGVCSCARTLNSSDRPDKVCAPFSTAGSVSTATLPIVLPPSLLIPRSF